MPLEDFKFNWSSGLSSDTAKQPLGSNFQIFWPSSNLSSGALKPSVQRPYSTYTHWPSCNQSISGPTSNTWNHLGTVPSSFPIDALTMIQALVFLSPKSPLIANMLSLYALILGIWIVLLCVVWYHIYVTIREFDFFIAKWLFFIKTLT